MLHLVSPTIIVDCYLTMMDSTLMLILTVRQSVATILVEITHMNGSWVGPIHKFTTHLIQLTSTGVLEALLQTILPTMFQ